MKLAIIGFLITTAGCQEDLQKITIQGQVIDGGGKAVEDADVARYWSVYDSTPKNGMKTNKEGMFSIELLVGKGPKISSEVLMALDRDRKVGGLIVVPAKDFKERSTIKLGPLVTLRAKLDPGEVKPDSKNTTVDVVIEGEFLGIGSSKWESKDVAIKLPPGKYYLEIVGSEVQHIHSGIELTGKEPEVDLGTLKLKRIPRSGR